MFKMLEVVGRSETGYSAAVKKAIEELAASGESVHWFEVVEQRGVAKDGRLKEFQVKIKVAVESSAKVSAVSQARKEEGEEHVCPTCMQETGESGHMCVPVTGQDHRCEWCGSLIPDERHLCNDKIKELAYICNTCGRTAVKSEHLCNPKKIA